MRASLLYGGLNLLCSGVLAALTFFADRIPIAVLQKEGASGYAFLFGAFLFVPFVITITRLGLNSDESGPATPETKTRRAVLRRECPIWPISYLAGLAFIGGVLCLGIFTRVRVEPFFAFVAATSFISGMWFVFAYPIASRIFKDQPLFRR